MSQPEAKPNVFDPLGVMKGLRDASLEQWSKVMGDLVQSEQYARATGEMLDAYVSAAAPFRDALQGAIAKSLAEWNLPSREDVTRIAERMTNIELRLDDMEAKLDACLAAKSSNKSGAKK